MELRLVNRQIGIYVQSMIITNFALRFLIIIIELNYY